MSETTPAAPPTILESFAPATPSSASLPADRWSDVPDYHSYRSIVLQREAARACTAGSAKVVRVDVSEWDSLGAVRHESAVRHHCDAIFPFAGDIIEGFAPRTVAS